MKDKIKKMIEKYNSTNFLFTNLKETFYLSGADFDGFWLLCVKGKEYALCSKMIENQVKTFFKDKNVEVIANTPFTESIIKILKENTEKSIIIDAKYINTADFLILEQKLKAKNIKISTKIGVLDDLRMIKNGKEEEYLQKSCEIASKVLEIVKNELKPGLSELDIHYRILELFAKNHVKMSFLPIVAGGKNSANPHHSSSNYKFCENDIVMIDMGCVYKGYCSDLTRTYFLGKISSKFRKIWDVVKESQSAVLKQIKSGLPVSWADKTARAVISSAGYEENFIHTTGHGVGIEIHEMPSLSSNAQGFFLTQMAVTVEPGIYFPNEFGIRIEDTIIIKEDGCKILTSAPY